MEDKTSWEKELKVESVIEGLSELEKSEDGKVFAVGLKLKYWAGIPFQELFGNISPLKNKSEVSQRFYFFDGQTGISEDEANRFLKNRWLEREMQLKKKQPGTLPTDEADSNNHSSGSSLLEKKRVGKKKGTKLNKPVHS